MAKSIRMDSMTIEITKALSEYTEDVIEEVDEIAKEVAEQSAGELHDTSPSNTGKYRKGWKVRKVKDGYEVYNGSKPFLTHLLEKGHAKKGGGRVDAIVHIAPVEEKAIEEFNRRVEEAIRK